MSRIAVIIDKDFEDSEYMEPVKAFKEAGHEITHIGLKEGSHVRGKKEHTPVKIERSIKDVSPYDFDALLIPGGYSPDQLRVHNMAVHFVRDFVHSGKPVFAICHAAQLLISAKVLDGRKVTGWKSLVQDIKNAGAEFVDREVVEDANIISSRGPQDLPAFIDKSLSRLNTVHI